MSAHINVRVIYYISCLSLCILIAALCQSCDFLKDKNPKYSTIIGSGNGGLICDSAKVHPYPVLLGLSQSRPQGKGTVTYYGNENDSYAGSPEVVWIITVDSGTINLFLTHDPEDDLDLFLLRGCDAESVISYSKRRNDNREQILHKINAGGTYYVVADGYNGKFNGLYATLQVELIE